MGGFAGGPGAAGRFQSGIYSSGFTGIAPMSAGMGLGPRGGRGGMGGMGGMMGPSAAGPRGNAPAQVQAPPAPNGYAIMGYAKDPESLLQFIQTLRENPRFKQVHFNEANVERVSIYELDNAMTAQGNMGGGYPVSGGAPGETVLRFSVDVQFGGTPVAPATGMGAAGPGGPEGGPPMGGTRRERRRGRRM